MTIKNGALSIPTAKSINNNNNLSKTQIEDKSVITRRNFFYVNEGDFGIVWKNVSIFAVGHLAFLYAIYVSLAHFSWKTQLWTLFLLVWAGIGITAGAHRLWAHRSYKAKLPLRIFLAIGQSIAGQNCIYIWARDHRIHHKYSDTDADPHNIHRGFFFSHVGWLMMKKHPEIKLKGAQVDFTDLRNDPVVWYQEKFYYPIFIIFAICLPVCVPTYFWGESIQTAFFVCFIHRMLVVLHGTWCVNSAAHMFGNRPYDGSIPPAENPYVSAMCFGEGYHNYHHKFPFDYATSELGYSFNTAKSFIDYMARIGQAYDLKRVQKHTVDTVKNNAAKSDKTKFYF